MQKVLSLLISAAILYTIIQMNRKPKQDTDSSPKQVEVSEQSKQTNIAQTQQDAHFTGNFLEQTISKIVINVLKTEGGRVFFENLLQPMNKPFNMENYAIAVNRDLVQPIFKIRTSGIGTAGPASCGHLVTIQYKLFDLSNNLLNNDTKTFTLGSRAIMPGIDSVVVGMMVGQSREAMIPTEYAYTKEKPSTADANSTSYKINITLKSILPANYVKNNEVKVFDDQVAYQVPLLCGDKVVFDAKITRLSNGTVLYDSTEKGQKLDMKLGDISYPLIFSYALHGKAPIGTRTVIAKSRSFKAIESTLNKVISNDKLLVDEYLMLELSNFTRQ